MCCMGYGPKSEAKALLQLVKAKALWRAIRIEQQKGLPLALSRRPKLKIDGLAKNRARATPVLHDLFGSKQCKARRRRLIVDNSMRDRDAAITKALRTLRMRPICEKADVKPAVRQIELRPPKTNLVSLPLKVFPNRL